LIVNKIVFLILLCNNPAVEFLIFSADVSILE